MYLNKSNTRRAEAIIGSLSQYPNISSSGSVSGMIKLYNWKRGGTVRSGSYIYNVGIENVNRIKQIIK